jgi:flagellar protein FlaF
MFNAHAAAAEAYGRLDVRMVDPMRAEALVFARITRRLEALDADPSPRHADLVSALNDNLRLWFAVAAAVADDGNAMPEGLRASLLSLADFVERRTRTLLQDGGSAATLTEINRRVAGGLTQAGG